MRLWLLRPVEWLPKNDNPWDPSYDKAFGFVVRADTEEEARSFAQEDAGDEACGNFLQGETVNTNVPWLDSKYSTCVELLQEGAAGVVMKDSTAG